MFKQRMGCILNEFNTVVKMGGREVSVQEYEVHSRCIKKGGNWREALGKVLSMQV